MTQIPSTLTGNVSSVSAPLFSQAAIKRREFYDKAFTYLFRLSAFIGVAAVATIGYFLIRESLPAWQYAGVKNMVMGTEWIPPVLFGLAPMIVASLITAIGAVIIGVPVALLTAVFLAEVAPKRLADAVRPAIELLAGIPSVVYGFFGLVVIVPAIEKIFNVPSGLSLFAAIIVLAVMILPTVISIAETSLRALPPYYKEGALALGASPMYTIFKVLLPAARSGIMAGVVLGIARALGETMAVIMVMGNSAIIPQSLLDYGRSLTANIALEMAYAHGIQANALYSTGVVLLVFIMILNATLLYINRQRVSK